MHKYLLISLVILSSSVSAAMGASEKIPNPALQTIKRDIQQENTNLELVYHFYNQLFNLHKTEVAEKSGCGKL